MKSITKSLLVAGMLVVFIIIIASIVSLCTQETTETNNTHQDIECDQWSGDVCIDNTSNYYGCDVVKEFCSKDLI